MPDTASPGPRRAPMPPDAPLLVKDRLVAVLDSFGEIAVAVSGGVDSMTLAYVAHRFGRAAATMFHAVSPAVPAEATARVEAHARRHGWDLHLIDAGEFADADYLRNPVDRCYYCKSNLYNRIRRGTVRVIASGTNLDDLGDFRPGLHAAAERGVVHPFVEAGITKADIYAMAGAYGLDDLAALPAQPCLSSRIETGIAVAAEDLRFVELVENRLAGLVAPGTPVRCRVTASGIIVEVGKDEAPPAEAGIAAAALCSEAGRHFAGIRPYRRGSAFLRT